MEKKIKMVDISKTTWNVHAVTNAMMISLQLAAFSLNFQGWVVNEVFLSPCQMAVGICTGSSFFFFF